jgi:hypothetical protein
MQFSNSSVMHESHPSTSYWRFFDSANDPKYLTSYHQSSF